MTWHTTHLTERGRTLGRLVDEHPYLSGLLLGRDPGWAHDRAQNLVRALETERRRPEHVETLPYHLVLDPASYCNLRCPLCVQATDGEGRPRKAVALELFDDVLAQVAESVVRVDLFNWGEPLLHPDFPLLAEHASRAFYTRTSTHLSLAKLDAERLVASGLEYLVVSIDGATQETYERYRVRGELALVLANLREVLSARARLRSLTPLIDWQYLVFPHNESEVGAALELARALGVDVFRHGGARGRMATKVLVDTRTNVQQSGGYMLPGGHPLSEYDEHGEKSNARERDGCRWLWGKMAVNADGGIAPCWSSWFAKSDIGNCSEQRLMSAWRGPAYTAARRDAHEPRDRDTLCATCARNRSFVNAPDRMDAAFDLQAVRHVAGVLAQVGRAPVEAVRRAVETGLRMEPTPCT